MIQPVSAGSFALRVDHQVYVFSCGNTVSTDLNVYRTEDTGMEKSYKKAKRTHFGGKAEQIRRIATVIWLARSRKLDGRR